jgi:hypothetical protein
MSHAAKVLTYTPASSADVLDLLGVLKDSLLSPDFSLILGHFDPPDSPPSS